MHPFFLSGQPELEENFKKLKKLQIDYGQAANAQDKEQEEVRRLRALNARYEGEVNTFRERETLKTSVKNMEKKKCWMVYTEEKLQYDDANDAAEKLVDAYKTAAASFKPLEQKIAKQEQSVTRTQEAQKLKVAWNLLFWLWLKPVRVHNHLLFFF